MDMVEMMMDDVVPIPGLRWRCEFTPIAWKRKKKKKTLEPRRV